MSDEKKATSISIPNELYRQVDRRTAVTRFESVDEYVTFTLEEVLAEVDVQNETAPDGVNDTEVRARLESLGYLED